MTESAKLDRFARQLAGKLAKGKPPALTAEMAVHLEEQPDRLFDSLAGFVEHVGDDADEGALGIAYLMLMSIQLEYLRYGIDRGYEKPKAAIAELERQLLSMARSGALSGSAFSLITGAMREAKLPPGADLLAANEELMDAESLGLAADIDINSILEQLADDFGDDVFALIEAMNQATHATPAEFRSVLAGQMITGPFPRLREAAPLMLFDGDKEVRRAVGAALLQAAASLTATTVRRLIAIRNWLPENERPLVDEAVREARTKGVACAGWEPRPDSEIQASPVDGSGAQAFMAVSPDGKRRRLSSILLKASVGVADAWSMGPSTKREIQRMLTDASAEVHLLRSDRDLLDRAVGHHLDVGLSRGAVPPAGLLQAAEAIGAADWRPARLDWREILDDLLGQVPPPLLEQGMVQEIVETSADWAAEDGLSESWFEDDQEVERVLRQARRGPPDALARRVLDGIVEPRKLNWAERFLWIALWLKSSPESSAARWPAFAILARELAQGRPAGTIPLMEDIALRTVVALRD